MYAVIATGGKQYKVSEGDTIRVEKLAGESGEKLLLNNVLMFSDGANVAVGQPGVADVAVHASIVQQGKARKILVFKFKRRKHSRKRMGHRQEFTALHIDRIEANALQNKEL